MLYKILILLLEIGFGITLNVVGTISISELALIFFALFYVRRSLFLKYPILKIITWLYFGLLVSQILSEIVIGNTINNTLKGIAVTIVSYLHFIFLFNLFVKNRKLVIYVIIGVLLRSLMFGTVFEGNTEEALGGESATFLKFYLGPILINIVLLISIFFNKKMMALCFTLLGVLFLFIGARSLGVSVFLSGIATYSILLSKKKIKIASLIRITLLMVGLGYGGYVFYVNSVVKGEITSGNSYQIKRLQNPYNPFNLLMMGRTETFVGAIAFMEKPLFGHGAWAKDGTGKYHALQLAIKDLKYKETDRTLIPAHSVLIGAGMRNGILAFIFMGAIILFFLLKGIMGMNRYDPYIMIIVYFILFVLWNGLFSPVSHFRQTLPLPFAFLLVSYLKNQK